jgi:hypothetical protein
MNFMFYMYVYCVYPANSTAKLSENKLNKRRYIRFVTFSSCRSIMHQIPEKLY